MESFELLNSEEIVHILEGLKDNHLNKGIYEFNIFSLSTYGNQLENFHSDIIGELLNPHGLHKEGNKLLQLFLGYLCERGADINISEFNNVSVLREKGRIDIAIIDRKSMKAIIIENKINNAPDMNEQLERYYTWCGSNGYDVCCVVYLTLSGEKYSPSIASNINLKPINIEAFSNSRFDLVNGWIIPSIGLCSTFDTTSLLKQYSKLIINLAYDKMNNTLLEEFYSLSDDLTAIKKIEKLKELSNQIPKYRMDKFVIGLGEFRPFTKSYRYKPYHMLYERFIEHDNSFKLDVWYSESGNAQIHFWNPLKEGTNAFESVKKKIEQIGYLDILKESPEGWIGFYKKFEFSDFGSMSLMDKNLIEFVRKFINDLERSKIE